MTCISSGFKLAYGTRSPYSFLGHRKQWCICCKVIWLMVLQAFDSVIHLTYNIATRSGLARQTSGSCCIAVNGFTSNHNIAVQGPMRYAGVVTVFMLATACIALTNLLCTALVSSTVSLGSRHDRPVAVLEMVLELDCSS